MKSNRTKGIIDVTGAVLLAITFFTLLFIHLNVNIFHYNVQMDSDIASDTLLGPVIYENGYTVPSTWYASSEKCVISAPNLAAFIYPLVGRNMNLAMGISCNLFMILFFLTMFVYYRQMKFSWGMCCLSGALILSLSDVFSENQSLLFLWAAYYAGHFITLYVISFFYNYCLKKDRVPVAIWIVSIILAFLNSLQGTHASLFCYLPLLAVEMLRRIVMWAKRRNYREGLSVFVWLLLLSIIAVAGSNIAGSAYKSGVSRNIRHAGEKFVDLIWPALGGVLYHDSIPFITYVLAAMAVIGYVLLIVRLFTGAEKAEESSDGVERWSLLSHIVSLVICILSLTFTTFDVAPRYFIAELFIVGVGVMILSDVSDYRLRLGITVLTVIVGLTSAKYYYTNLIQNDDTKSRDEYLVGQWMQENGYKYGYATFDFANAITVISNDAVRVRAINTMNELEGMKWLSDATWYPPTKNADGATCYITTDASKGEFEEWMQNNGVDALSMNAVGRFTVYVLDRDYTEWK